MSSTPFRIAVPDDVLRDLAARLRASRFSTASDATPWRAGADPDYLRALVATWADGFDWRAREQALNELPQFETVIDGKRLHYLHLRAAGSRRHPLPLILSHGWPSSFVEMLPLATRLANGDGATTTFDVVVPSLPGFLYSDAPAVPATRAALAEILHALMTRELGHGWYGAFGGDIGGGVTTWMAVLHPDALAGIHLIHPPSPGSFDDSPATPEEQAWIDADKAYDETDAGYSSMMATRPDTTAAALVDSPVGLAAWILDKYRDWTDCDGDLESRIDRETLLTILTLYWVSDCIGSSFRTYYDYHHNRPRPPIAVPTAVTLSNEPVFAGFPRSLTERVCRDLRHWREPARGGHFLPLEDPDLMADELRGFFGSLA